MNTLLAIVLILGALIVIYALIHPTAGQKFDRLMKANTNKNKPEKPGGLWNDLERRARQNRREK